MMDIVSMLRRGNDNDLMVANNLFMGIYEKGFILSVQASKSHCCSPQIDNLPAYMYDTFEVAIYIKGELPTSIKKKFADRFDEYCDIIANISSIELNCLYEEMCTMNLE